MGRRRYTIAYLKNGRGLRAGIDFVLNSFDTQWKKPAAASPSIMLWWILITTAPSFSLKSGIKKNLYWTVSYGSLIYCCYAIKSPKSLSVWIPSMSYIKFASFCFHS